MTEPNSAGNPRDRAPTTRLLTLITVLFFATLAIGTYAGGVFLRDSIRQERLVIAENRLDGFVKALRTIFTLTAHVGEALANTLETGDQADIASFRQTTAAYLKDAPWTKAVIVRRPGGNIVVPQSSRETMLALPTPPDNATNRSFFGPYTLSNGEKALVYRFYSGNDVVELVIGFREVLEAIGLLELAQSTQLSVETLGETNATAVAGNPGLATGDTLGSTFQIGNAKWTIRIRPAPLNEGPHNWSRTLLVGGGILGLAFLAPFIALLLLLRARLQDNRHIRDSLIEIENLSRHLDVALHASHIGLWEHDLETGEEVWDEQLLKIYGIKGNETRHTFEEWLTYLHPDDRAQAASFNGDLNSDAGFQHEFRIITPGGIEKTVRSAGNAYVDASGRKKLVGVSWDVSADKATQAALAGAKAKAEAQNAELEEAHRKMERLALEDALTGVPNRRHFEKRLEAAQSDGNLKAGTKIVLIDLDGFKTLNDTMGHFFGDEVLRFAARVFTQKLGPDDFLARTGGDEFVVLIPPESDVDAFADELTDAFARPVEIDGHTCRVGISLGIATVDAHSETAGDLLVKADLALYAAKNRGRGRTVHYTSELMAQTFKLKRMADELQEAVEKDEIAAFYQPIIDTRTGKVAGIEALARWRHPRRGLMEPKDFIAVAEQVGLLHKVDEIVFGKAIETQRLCAAAGLPTPVFSVNVSEQRLQDPSLLPQLSAFDLPPGKFHFELLESIPLDNSDNALLKIVREIRKAGIGIDLDDFGSGYASLVGLTQVRPDRLKIAGQLIEPIVRSAESLLIVETIARIARSFDIGLICEGVLSRQHRDKLDALGCHLQQGYFFTRPMDAGQIMQYLAQQPK